MRQLAVFWWIVGVSAMLNYQNNALYLFFVPVFSDKAIEKGIGASVIGLVLAMFSISLVFQSFLMDRLHKRLGSKKTYLLGVSGGIVVSLLALALPYASLVPFVLAGALLRLIDGARETQFEVAAFVYFAENVLECTTEKLQGQAIATYKVVGAVGYLIGALQGPLFLHFLGYDGAWCVFLGSYMTALTLIWTIFPDLQDHEEHTAAESQALQDRDITTATAIEMTDTQLCVTQEASIQEVDGSTQGEQDESMAADGAKSLKDVTLWQIFALKDLWPCYIAIFLGLFASMGTQATMTLHVVQDFNYNAHITFYFFAVWAVGQTVGNAFAFSMIHCVRPVIRVAMILQIIACSFEGPSNLFPQLSELSKENKVIVCSIGLFLMGFAAAALQTMGNIESVVRAQRWASIEYPGQGVSSLITNLQSCNIVFIGLGESVGQLAGAVIYDYFGFSWQCDLFSFCIICGLIAVIYLDWGYNVEKQLPQNPQKQVKTQPEVFGAKQTQFEEKLLMA